MPTSLVGAAQRLMILKPVSLAMMATLQRRQNADGQSAMGRAGGPIHLDRPGWVPPSVSARPVDDDGPACDRRKYETGGGHHHQGCRSGPLGQPGQLPFLWCPWASQAQRRLRE